MTDFCSSCGSALIPGARFCASCGTTIAHRCVSCDAELPHGAAFCPACGTTQAQLAPPPSASEELRVISAMFVDLAGFTAHTERSDPEDVRARLSIFHRTVREDVERFGGSVEKLLGDGVFAVFGVPNVYEDDAERAVRAALRIQTSVEELNQADQSLGLSIRIGVTTGEAIVLLEEEGIEERIIGDVVNTASRLEGIAEPGTVVVDERTYLAVRSAVECVPLASVSVKGKAGSLSIWRAVEARSRFGVAVDDGELSAFIGRAEELALLEDAFDRAIARRSPQLVTITGEPGVGKSRLVREFFAATDSRPYMCRWRQGRNLPYGEGVTFWALSEIVKSEAGILESESAERATTKLADSVGSLAESGEAIDVAWLRQRLGPLAGTGAAEGVDRGELFSAWLQYFELLAVTTPLVMVIEDLHWADESLADFLEHLLDWAQDAPILVLCTARPEWFDRRPGWGGGKREAVSVGLAPLTEDETAHLVTALSDRAVMPAEAQQALTAQSGGNPLYVTEYVRLAIEQGWFEPGYDLGALPLPDSVQSIIASRLDLLEPEDKATIQAAAVVGRVFWTGSLTFVRGLGEPTIHDSLVRLVRRELIKPVRRSSMEGQDEFTFLHVLARDVAYGQLPRGERARLHRETARWLEAVSGGREIDVAELLAYHHTTALELEPSDDPDLLARVYRFLMLAGERTESLDLERTVGYFIRAAAIATEPADRAKALLERGKIKAGHRQDTVDALTEAVQAFDEVGDVLGKAEALAARSGTHWWGGDKTQSTADSQQAMDLIEGAEPSEVVAEILVGRALQCQLAGDEEATLDIVERAIAVAREVGDTKNYATALRAKGGALSQLGLDGGLELTRQSLGIHRDRGETVAAMSAYNNIATFLGDSGEITEALEVIDEAIAYGRSRGAPTHVDWSIMTKTESLFRIGSFDEIASLASDMITADEARGGSQTGLFAKAARAYVDWIRGDEGQWPVHRDLVEQAYAIEDPQVLVPALASTIQVAESAGSTEEAGKYVDDFIEVAATHPAFLGLHLFKAARGLLSAGKRDVLERLVDDALELSEWITLSLDWVRALILEYDGLYDEALDLLRPVVEDADRRQMKYYATWARIDAARCALAAQRSDEAGDLIETSRSAAQEMGAALLVRQIDDLVAHRTDRAAGA